MKILFYESEIVKMLACGGLILSDFLYENQHLDFLPFIWSRERLRRIVFNSKSPSPSYNKASWLR